MIEGGFCADREVFVQVGVFVQSQYIRVHIITYRLAQFQAGRSRFSGRGESLGTPKTPRGAENAGGQERQAIERFSRWQVSKRSNCNLLIFPPPIGYNPGYEISTTL